MRPIIKSINTPAEVLFTRQADTSHRLEYAHVAFPLNISFVEQAVFNLEAAHRRWHKKTIYNSLPNNPTDALHHLPHNEGDSTWSRQSKYAATRLIRAKEHANRQRHLFSSIDSNIEEYTRAHPHEAHDFIVNRRARAARASELQSLRPVAPHYTKRLFPRGLPLIIGGVLALFGIGALTFSALYTANEVSRLHSNLRANDLSHTYREGLLGHAQSEMAEITDAAINLMAKHWSSYDDGHVTLFALDVIEARLNMFDQAIMAGLMGRLSPSVLLEVDTARVTARIERIAKSRGMVQLANHLSDWLQFEATLVATKEGADIILHVPLVDDAAIMHIYQFHPLPIPLGHDLHLSLDPAPFTYLAVDRRMEKFRALTLAQLQACRSVGLFRLCDFGSVVRHAPKTEDQWPDHIDGELCLFALMAREFRLAGRVCTSHIGSQEAALVQLGPSTFASYSTTADRGTVECHGTSASHLAFTIGNLSKISLPFGCTAMTNTHTFSSADDSLTRDDDDAYVALEYEWPTPITDLTQDLDLKAWADLHNRSQAHLRHAHALVPLSTAIAQVEEARLRAEQDAAWTAGSAHSMFTPLIVFVLLAAAVTALVCWGRRALFRVRFLESSVPYHSTSSPLAARRAHNEAAGDSQRMSFKELLEQHQALNG